MNRGCRPNYPVMCVDAEKENLRELCVRYLSRKYDVETEKTALTGKSGARWKFDLIVSTTQQGGGKFGVFVRDWIRAIGINQMRRLEKACRDCGMVGAMIVGNFYGMHAKTYGENLGIQVLYRSQIERKLDMW
ncbi:MAG: hypothetical protein ACTSU5_01535 [Promethearchaeota archaeon]